MLMRCTGCGLAEAALIYAFETHGVGQVWAATDPPNQASVRVLEWLGMCFERSGELGGLPALFYRLNRS
jgi:RimJ/RimL family protein N-acetyltransferase